MFWKDPGSRIREKWRVKLLLQLYWQNTMKVQRDGSEYRGELKGPS